jgi:hypothetical protein
MRQNQCAKINAPKSMRQNQCAKISVQKLSKQMKEYVQSASASPWRQGDRLLHDPLKDCSLQGNR